MAIDFDYDLDEMVSWSGDMTLPQPRSGPLGGNLTLRTALKRIGERRINVQDILQRDQGKTPPTFDAKQIERLISALIGI